MSVCVNICTCLSVCVSHMCKPQVPTCWYNVTSTLCGCLYFHFCNARNRLPTAFFNTILTLQFSSFACYCWVTCLLNDFPPKAPSTLAALPRFLSVSYADSKPLTWYIHTFNFVPLKLPQQLASTNELSMCALIQLSWIKLRVACLPACQPDYVCHTKFNSSLTFWIGKSFWVINTNCKRQQHVTTTPYIHVCVFVVNSFV